MRASSLAAIFGLPIDLPAALPERFAGLPTWLFIVINVAVGAALVILLTLLFRFLRAWIHLVRTGRHAKRVSAAASKVELPLVTFRRNGNPSDPLNLRVVATESQLAAAFAAAGWYRADEITLITALRIAIDSILARKYSTAPVSNLYLFGRRQDIAFEQPGSSVRQRDHVRFWKTTVTAPDGRPLWIGATTKDIAVALSPATRLPTHLIDANVDAERDFLVEDLAATGWVIKTDWAAGFGLPTTRDNGDGGQYHTDGRVAVVVLADVIALPVAQQVRGPVLAGITKNIIGPLLRGTLPRAGRERADEVRQERERRRRRTAEEAAVTSRKDARE